MSKRFSKKELAIMQLAVKQANRALSKGNYPAGAVLVVDGRVTDYAYNKKEENKDRFSHAEILLLERNSKKILTWNKSGKRIEVYTTYEPCLMCLGACVIHRINRIVIACPDPRGDMSQINPKLLGKWYKRHWPKIIHGLCFSESYKLLLKFFSNRKDKESKEALALFKKMKNPP